MSKRGIWIPQKMTYVKNNRVRAYRAYICSECNNEQMTRTNYCNRCGSLNYEEGTGDTLVKANLKVHAKDCPSCAFYSGRICSGDQLCKDCDNYCDGCNCWKIANSSDSVCPFWRGV